jgi:hypothetical protein
MRATRDLLRRRLFFARKRVAHIQNTNTQYNLPALESGPTRPRIEAPSSSTSTTMSSRCPSAADIALLDSYDQVIRDMELYLIDEVRKDHNREFYLLRSIPGIGEILSLTLLYEIHDLSRFPRVQDFLSYARLVKGTHESAGKTKKLAGGKMGNVHLKWAFSEAAALFLRANPIGQKYFAKLEKKHGKGRL